jgi:hypothetical protein
MATMTLNVRDTAVIPYPPEELAELNTLLELDGMLTVIFDNTEITPPTTKAIANKGRGQKAKVDKLREFVKSFNKQFPAKRA